MIKPFLFAVLLLSTCQLRADNLKIPNVPGDEVQFYLLTMGKGQEVVDRWGHTALRVMVPQANFDQVFNWGIYDFKKPNFVWNFVRGRLLYKLATAETKQTLGYYDSQNRWVQQNIINLTGPQKEKLTARINQNLDDPEYYYHFRADNCATRLRDHLDSVLGGQLRRELSGRETQTTFREYIRYRLADHPEASAMLNILLGGRIDSPMTEWELLFLPENIPEILKDRLPDLLGDDQIIVDGPLLSFSGTWASLFWHFGFVHVILLILMGWFGFRNKAQVFCRRVATYAQFFLGLISTLIVVAWFFTDHGDAQWNAILFLSWPSSLLLVAKVKPEWLPAGLKALSVFGILFATLLGVSAQDIWHPALMLLPLVGIELLAARLWKVPVS